MEYLFKSLAIFFLLGSLSFPPLLIMIDTHIRTYKNPVFVLSDANIFSQCVALLSSCCLLGT